MGTGLILISSPAILSVRVAGNFKNIAKTFGGIKKLYLSLHKNGEDANVTYNIRNKVLFLS